ncbi:hypothetical protein [Ideonella sp.]|jgi:hypothetical protein|uniref:hypothetical protein n=1 Tax=Ideonella sp. TaxID=1929293 RepID=UPI0037C18C4D
MTEKSSSGLARLTEEQLSRIVFFMGGVRSGTTVFRRMMASHALIRDRGEIFNSNNPLGYFKFLREQVALNPDLIFPERSPEVFQAYLVSLLPKEPNAIALLDIKYEHLTLLPEAWQMPFTNPPLLRTIKRSKVKVLHLRRQHFFSVVSNLVAVSTGRYHHRVGHDKALPDKRQVTIDKAQLLSAMKKRRRATDLIDSGLDDQQRLSIDYESVFDEAGHFRAEVCDAVAGFLGLEPSFDREPELKKVIDEPLSSLITNYQDIAELEKNDN